MPLVRAPVLEKNLSHLAMGSGYVFIAGKARGDTQGVDRCKDFGTNLGCDLWSVFAWVPGLRRWLAPRWRRSRDWAPQ